MKQMNTDFWRESVLYLSERCLQWNALPGRPPQDKLCSPRVHYPPPPPGRRSAQRGPAHCSAGVGIEESVSAAPGPTRLEDIAKCSPPSFCPVCVPPSDRDRREARSRPSTRPPPSPAPPPPVFARECHRRSNFGTGRGPPKMCLQLFMAHVEFCLTTQYLLRGGGGRSNPPPPPLGPPLPSANQNFFLAPSVQVGLDQKVCSAPLTTQGLLRGGGGGTPRTPPPRA